MAVQGPKLMKRRRYWCHLSQQLLIVVEIRIPLWSIVKMCKFVGFRYKHKALHNSEEYKNYGQKQCLTMVADGATFDATHTFQHATSVNQWLLVANTAFRYSLNSWRSHQATFFTSSATWNLLNFFRYLLTLTFLQRSSAKLNATIYIKTAVRWSV